MLTTLVPSTDRTIKIWDRESGRCAQTLVGHRGGRLLVSGPGRSRELTWLSLSCYQPTTIRRPLDLWFGRWRDPSLEFRPTDNRSDRSDPFNAYSSSDRIDIDHAVYQLRIVPTQQALQGGTSRPSRAPLEISRQLTGHAMTCSFKTSTTSRLSTQVVSKRCKHIFAFMTS